MSEEQKNVLAIYEFRGKQEFIYRTNAMKEIIGASWMIKDGFQYLYKAVQNIGKGIYNYQKDKKDLFSIEGFRKHLKEGYVGEVVYEGGGNLIVLYQDETLCKTVNKIFSTLLIQKTYSLKALCAYIEVDLEQNNFKEDRAKLYQKKELVEARETIMGSYNTLPIVQIDAKTSQPLMQKSFEGKEEQKKVTKESFLKLQYYKNKGDNDLTEASIIEERKSESEEGKLLDDLGTKKGEESWLAVIYIDGNNMGMKVNQCLIDKKTYEECISTLRDLSGKIEENYVKNGMKNVDEKLNELKLDKKEYKKRVVVAAGDEVTFICNARVAYEVTKAYLLGLEKNNTSCAGIAIFKSHAPFADVYHIAEEACENGKKRMKKNKEKPLQNACLLDFHYCQGGLGISLEKIREKEGRFMSRPWLVRIDEEEEKLLEEDTTREEIDAMIKILNKLEKANIKPLAESALQSKAKFEKEWMRLQAYHGKEEENIDLNFEHDKVFNKDGKINKEKIRKIIYDLIIMYDLWFEKEEVNKGGEVE